MSLDRMSEADRPQVDGVKRGLPGAALAAIALGLGTLGMAVATSDDQFARGLEAAIAAGPAAQATARSAPRSASSSSRQSLQRARWSRTSGMAAPAS